MKQQSSALRIRVIGVLAFLGIVGLCMWLFTGATPDIDEEQDDDSYSQDEELGWPAFEFPKHDSSLGEETRDDGRPRKEERRRELRDYETDHQLVRIHRLMLHPHEGGNEKSRSYLMSSFGVSNAEDQDVEHQDPVLRILAQMQEHTVVDHFGNAPVTTKAMSGGDETRVLLRRCVFAQNEPKTNLIIAIPSMWRPKYGIDPLMSTLSSIFHLRASQREGVKLRVLVFLLDRDAEVVARMVEMIEERFIGDVEARDLELVYAHRGEKLPFNPQSRAGAEDKDKDSDDNDDRRHVYGDGQLKFFPRSLEHPEEHGCELQRASESLQQVLRRSRTVADAAYMMHYVSERYDAKTWPYYLHLEDDTKLLDPQFLNCVFPRVVESAPKDFAWLKLDDSHAPGANNMFSKHLLVKLGKYNLGDLWDASALLFHSADLVDIARFYLANFDSKPLAQLVHEPFDRSRSWYLSKPPWFAHKNIGSTSASALPFLALRCKAPTPLCWASCPAPPSLENPAHHVDSHVGDQSIVFEHVLVRFHSSSLATTGETIAAASTLFSTALRELCPVKVDESLPWRGFEQPMLANSLVIDSSSLVVHVFIAEHIGFDLPPRNDQFIARSFPALRQVAITVRSVPAVKKALEVLLPLIQKKETSLSLCCSPFQIASLALI